MGRSPQWRMTHRRMRSAPAFKRSSMRKIESSRSLEKHEPVRVNLTAAKSTVVPEPKKPILTLGRSFSRQGLGAAIVHSNYEHRGEEFTPAPFLKHPQTVRVIGAPMSYGQPLAGTDQGAQILRDCGLESTLASLEWRVDSVADLVFEEPKIDDPAPDPGRYHAKNCYTVGKALEIIHNEVYKAVEDDEFALILGGDHSISAGSLAAILRKRPETGIVWVDAHGDLNTPETSPSGNMHGMPLGLMLRLIDPTVLPGFEWFEDVPRLSPDQISFVGLRDLDEAERKVIKEFGITAYTMHHVDRYGIGAVMEMAIENLRMDDGILRPLHLSYDIDSVDPQEAPSTGTVVRGGLTFREAHYVAESVSNTGMLGSMDLVEVNPKLTLSNESEMTAELGMALIASAMGSRII